MKAKVTVRRTPRRPSYWAMVLERRPLGSVGHLFVEKEATPVLLPDVMIAEQKRRVAEGPGNSLVTEIRYMY